MERRYGRIVLTTSTGALGSAALTAYGTAKAGVLGFGRALAQVGLGAGIAVNIVAPMAMTRMMAAGLPGDDDEMARAEKERDPGLVAPLVAYLCHESCPSTGETYLSGMRRYARFVIAESEGYVHPGLGVTPEDIAGHWDEIDELRNQVVVTDTHSWGDRNRQQIEERTPATAR